MNTRFLISDAASFFKITCQARRLSPNTINDYSNTLRKLTVFTNDKAVDLIDKNVIRSFLAGQEVCNKTLLNYHTGLSSFFKWLLSENLVTTNPMVGVERPRPEKRVIEPIPVEHIRLMLAATTRSASYKNNSKIVTNNMQKYSARSRAIVLFLLDTGVRVGELISIEKQLVDFKSGCVKVFGKGNKERIIYFSATTATALWKYVMTHEGHYLFMTDQGRQMDRNNVAHILARLCKRAGVPVYSPHDFRHTFAVNYLRNYPNIYALQQMLGHSSLDMVKRYLVISQQDLKVAHMHASPVEHWHL